MTDYLKFWLAKELLPLLFLATLAAIIAFLFVVIYLADLVRRTWRRVAR